MRPEAETCVAVVDLGVNNLASISRRLDDAGAGRVFVLDEAADLTEYSHVVLPGVGAFHAAMSAMLDRGWPDELRRASGKGMPILGICLGMHLLGASSEEGEPIAGLGLVPGRTVRLSPRQGERIPHVGWNEVVPLGASALFRGVEAGTDFYFVHSYTMVPDDAQHVAASTPYAQGVRSAISRDNIFGVQFHPEKSSAAGLQVLRNFL